MSEIKVASTLVPIPLLSADEPVSPATGSQWVVGAGDWSGAGDPTPGTIGTWNGSSWDTFTSTWTVENPGAFAPAGITTRVARVSAIETMTNDGCLGHGAADGTNECAYGMSSNDGEADTSVFNIRSHTSCVAVPQPDATYTLGLSLSDAGASSNDWLLNIDTASTVQHYLEVTFWGGADISFAVYNTTTPSSLSVSSLGFDPNLLIGICGEGTTALDNMRQHARLGRGYCVDDGSDTQGCVVYYERNGRGDGYPRSGTSNAVFLGDAADTGGMSQTVTVTGFQTGGFTMTATLDIALSVVCIDTGDRGVSVDWITTPTSATTQSYTGTGFTPQHLDGIMTSEADAPPSGSGDFEAGSLGLFAVDSEVLSLSAYADDNATTTNASTLVADDSLILYADDGSTLLHDVISVTFDADGYDFEFNTSDSTARYWLVLAVEAEATAGPAPAILVTPDRVRRAVFARYR